MRSKQSNRKQKRNKQRKRRLGKLGKCPFINDEMKFPQTRLRSLHSAKQTYLEIKISENKETTNKHTNRTETETNRPTKRNRSIN